MISLRHLAAVGASLVAIGSAAAMPAASSSFPGQGHTVSPTTVTGTPPDMTIAVGPNHVVQTVNGGVMVWNKAGTVLQASRLLGSLWTGYGGTNAGNGCGTRNDGNPKVLYDALADRWFITQWSIPNSTTNAGPSFECVAVSKTGDPTGAYNLYDFAYQAAFNDAGQFAVWPDAYYASFNLFSTTSFLGALVCAYDRVKMLAGLPATQHCFQQSNTTFGLVPASLDGPVAPPAGEPGFFLGLGTNALELWTFHIDWNTPANTTLTGPTTVAVASFSTPASDTTVPQSGSAVLLQAASDRPGRVAYRNFGIFESLTATHTVSASATTGVRWYELRSPNATPVVYQQGTHAPADASWRWLGSVSQDQAQDMAVGFSVSSSTSFPSIGWTGRLATDAAGTMGQAEAIVAAGSAASTVSRWGPQSDLVLDPSGDCTFWYTNELYATAGSTTWETQIAAVRFPRCAASDFSLTVSPATQSLPTGNQVAYTVSTTSTLGAAESISFAIQDLPAGVTGAFLPTAVTAGSAATLTLTAAVGAAITGAPAPTFTVVGKAPSAVHAAVAQVAVVTCTPATTCPAHVDCGDVPDGCGGTLYCGACFAPMTCGGGGAANVCGCTPLVACPGGDNCGTVPDGCGGIVACGTCTAPQTCGGGGTGNVCGCTPLAACPPGDVCGTVPNGCGGTVACGTCSGTDTCVANACVASGGGGSGGGGGGGGGKSGGCGTGPGGVESFALVALALVLVRRGRGPTAAER